MKFHGQFDPPLDQLLYERYFAGRRNGVFLECGALDGLLESTCRFFEESMGWSGINVEPVPFLFERLLQNRPRGLNLNVALSDRPGTARFTHAVHPVHGWRFGNGSLQHTPSHRAQLEQGGCEFVEFDVRTLSFAELAGTLLPRGIFSCIDLMVLDVEGHEMAVLRGMHGARLLPRVLCVESGITDPAALCLAAQELGYQYDIDLHNNSLFVLAPSAV